MKCPRCQQENPKGQKFCGECGTPLQLLEGTAQPAPSQQPTTGAVLTAIPSLETDVQPVLEAIARTAARLCEAGDALIYAVDGDRHRLVAKYGRVPFPQRVGDSHPIRRDTPLGLAVLDRRPIHVRDIRADRRSRFPGLHDVGLRVSRVRTLVAMPLLREGVAIGGIVIRRTRVQPFTAKQVALLKTFADQAAIAIENVRLSNETKEALEQQTATSEILRVISSSPTDMQPVMDAVAENAARVCGAADALIFHVEGDALHRVAQFGSLAVNVPTVRRISRETPPGRAILERRTIHIEDIVPLLEAEYPLVREAAIAVGARTHLAAPLMREGVPIGAILIRRTTVQPFTGRQIELLKTFADQAVIAIENVRLFSELQEKNRALTQAHTEVTEALERQTATSEILRVISRSPTDLQPVLDALARSAVRFCGAFDATLFRVDGAGFRVVAHHGPIPFPVEAWWPLVRGRINGRSILDRRPVHVTDLQAESEEFPEGSALARDLGQRTTLVVPLMREGEAIGTIQLRRVEASRFTDTQIELLQTFADQAVIAIEKRPAVHRAPGEEPCAYTGPLESHRVPGAADGDCGDLTRHQQFSY